METAYILFILLGFGAALVSAVFGFGTALIALSVGSYLLPVKETIALATVLFCASTITKSFVFRKHIDWRLAAIMSLVSLPFAYFGAVVLTHVSAELLKRMLGAMVLLYLGLSWFNLFPRLRINTAALMAGSAGYGFISGLLGTGNIVKAILFREMNVDKEAFVGAMAATSVLANVAKVGAYSQAGLLDLQMLWVMIGLVIAATSAVLVGRKVLHQVSSKQFETGLNAVLAISALGLLV